MVLRGLSPQSWGVTKPSKTASAGPVIQTGAAPPSQAMVRGPPGRSIRAFGPQSPRLWHTTSVAQAPVPQARVGPAPRSQTRITRWAGSSTSTKCTLVLAGNAG